VRYQAQFTGRKLGAIGVFYPIATKVEGDTPEAARLALYAHYEHIHGLTLEPVAPEPTLDQIREQEELEEVGDYSDYEEGGCRA